MRKRVNLLVGWISLLSLILAGCGTADMKNLAIHWSKTESPPFPNEWPPTTKTVWIRYTFAYGSGPALMDGAYVTAPLSRTEWRGGVASTVTLSDALTEAGTQGIVPLDDATLALLEKGETISTFVLALSTLPDLSQSETQQMLAYYNAWFSHNGTFLNLIRADHAAFIDWILSNP